MKNFFGHVTEKQYPETEENPILDIKEIPFLQFRQLSLEDRFIGPKTLRFISLTQTAHLLTSSSFITELLLQKEIRAFFFPFLFLRFLTFFSCSKRIFLYTTYISVHSLPQLHIFSPFKLM